MHIESGSHPSLGGTRTERANRMHVFMSTSLLIFTNIIAKVLSFKI